MDDGDEHDVQRTLPLAELCHKRTHGNVYFLLTFIRMIHEEDLLEFNLNVFQWRWDVAKIEHETAAAENVVELVKERMIKTTTAVVDGDSKADRLEQGNGLVTLLKVAACFGATFDPKLLFVILQRLSHFHSPEETSNINGEYLLKDRVQFLLHTAVKEHFLEKMQGKTSYSGASDPRDEKQPSETYYRWAHDKVQEAAMSLLPEAQFVKISTSTGSNFTAFLKQSREEGKMLGGHQKMPKETGRLKFGENRITMAKEALQKQQELA